MWVCVGFWGSAWVYARLRHALGYIHLCASVGICGLRVFFCVPLSGPCVVCVGVGLRGWVWGVWVWRGGSGDVGVDVVWMGVTWRS